MTFALGDKTNKTFYIAVPFLPVVVFWVLDAYFLAQERLYRRLYNEAVAGKVEDYSLDASKFIGKKTKWIDAFLSHTILTFHLMMLVMVVIAGFITLKA